MFNNIIFVQRVIQGVLGVFTLFLVARLLSPEIQGWYYTFSSIAAAYTLFDLGFSVVLVQLSAHLFSHLKWPNEGQLDGQTFSQLSKLINQSVNFYMKLAMLYLIIVGSLGIVFFEYKAMDLNIKVEWAIPWVLLVAVTAINILTLPFIAVVEGSGEIREVYFLRIIQNIFGSLSLWLALILGCQLWALSFLPAISFLVVMGWLFYSKPHFLKIALAKNKDDFHWRHEVWPLQWRVGLSWLAGYLLTQIYTPILFYYQDAKVAGQMGLSLTVANMLGLLAQSWIARRVPDMGKSVANKDWERFDEVFKHDFYSSLSIYLVGSALLILMVLALNHATHYGERVLPVLPFVGLLIVVFVNHITGALASQLRSFKKEPLVFVTLISTLVTIPIALYGASEFSALGVIAAILLVQITFALPITVYFWLKFNREWRLD